MAVHRGPSTKWLFTRDQLENTPSRRCGIEADRELSYRQQAANLIQDIGQRLNVYPFWKWRLAGRVSISLQRGRNGKTCCNFIKTRLKSVVITYGGFYDNTGHLTWLARCLYLASWRRWGLNASLAIVLCHQTAQSIVTSVSNDIGDKWFEIPAACAVSTGHSVINEPLPSRTRWSWWLHSALGFNVQCTRFASCPLSASLMLKWFLH